MKIDQSTLPVQCCTWYQRIVTSTVCLWFHMKECKRGLKFRGENQFIKLAMQWT